MKNRHSHFKAEWGQAGVGGLIHRAAGAKSCMKVTCDYKTNTLQIIYCLCKHRSTVRGGHSLNSPSYVNVGVFEPFPPMSMNQVFSQHARLDSLVLI